MAVYETSGVMGCVDEDGNLRIHYPVTKLENVDGLDEALAAEKTAREQGLKGKADVSHTHTTDQVTGLDAALANKAAATHAAQHASGGSDPITPQSIGAVSKAGDTMKGFLRNTLDGVGYSSVTGSQTAAYLEAFRSDYNVRRQLLLETIEQNADDATAFKLWNSTSGRAYTMLHTGNFANYALPRNGSVPMTGALAVQRSQNDYSPYIAVDCIPSNTRFAMISGKEGNGCILLQDYPSFETKSGMNFTKDGKFTVYDGTAWHRVLHDGNFADWFKSSGQSSFTEIRSITTGEAANKVVLPLSDLNWGEWTRIHLVLSLGVQTNSYLSGDPSGASYIVPMVNGINANGAWKGMMQVLHDADFFFWMIYGGVQGSECLLRSGARFREIKSIYFQTTNTNLPIPAGATIKLYGER